MPHTRLIILSVDDDTNAGAIMSRAAQRCFPEAQFVQTTSAEQAQTFLDGYTGQRPCLVLLDIDLKASLTGFDFLRSVRAHTLGRLLSVVMLSDSREQQHITQSYELGASSYSIKPFSFGEWKTYFTQLRAYWLLTVTMAYQPAVYTRL